MQDSELTRIAQSVERFEVFRVGIIFFTSETPLFMEMLAATLAGLGLGAIPTVNALVVQYAAPKRLLGVSLGAIFFSITMGMAIAPAVLGSVMNVSCAAKLEKMGLPGIVANFDDLNSVGDTTSSRWGAMLPRSSFVYPPETMNKQAYAAALSRAIDNLTRRRICQARLGTIQHYCCK